MKTISILLVALLLLLSVPRTVSAAMVGDTKDAVLAELGQPDGYLGTATREVFTYERGHVELADGIVISAELISEEEAVRRRLKREAEEAARLERERERRERLRTEGTDIRLRRLADSDFMTASAAQRLAFWQQFRKHYPMVQLGDEYGAALRERELELAAENAAIAAERRIRNLEMRVAQAEADAAYASYYEQPTRVSSPVYYGSTAYRGSGGVVYAGSSGCTQSRRGRCRSSCRCKPKVTPLPSSAGYAFQRSRSKVATRSAGYAFQRPRNTVGVNVWTGKPVYEKSVCTPRVQQPRAMHSRRVGSPTPDFVASRPWITSGSTTVVRPASRGGLSVNARFSF